MTVTAIFVPERNRIYIRRFDHDQATRRRAAGESVADIAADYDVTAGAVYRVTTPGAKQKDVDSSRRWRTGTCESCGGPAMRLVCGKREHNPDGRALCKSCRGKEMRQNVRLDERGAVVAVCCDSMDCANGDRWQPPDSFPKGSRYRDLRDGGFHGLCRACNTRTKKRYRDARKAPCSHGCGRMVDTVDRRDKTKPLECRSCSRRRVAAEQRTPGAVTPEAPTTDKEREQSVA